jgi:uncharacterized DUF497 family protein
VNLNKHGFDFRDAHIVCEDPFGVDMVYFVSNEERCNTIGAFGPSIVAVATHTDRTIEDEEITRIISFRKANNTERRLYEDGNC